MLHKNKSINQRICGWEKWKDFLFVCVFASLITLLINGITAKYNIAPYSDIEGNTAQYLSNGVWEMAFLYCLIKYLIPNLCKLHQCLWTNIEFFLINKMLKTISWKCILDINNWLQMKFRFRAISNVIAANWKQPAKFTCSRKERKYWANVAIKIYNLLLLE